MDNAKSDNPGGGGVTARENAERLDLTKMKIERSLARYQILLQRGKAWGPQDKHSHPKRV